MSTKPESIEDLQKEKLKAEIAKIQEEEARLRVERLDLERNHTKSWFRKKEFLQGLTAGLVAVPLIWFYVKDIAIPLFQSDNVKLAMEISLKVDSLSREKRIHRQDVESLRFAAQVEAQKFLNDISKIRNEYLRIDSMRQSMLATIAASGSKNKLSNGQIAELELKLRRLATDAEASQKRLETLNTEVEQGSTRLKTESKKLEAIYAEIPAEEYIEKKLKYKTRVYLSSNYTSGDRSPYSAKFLEILKSVESNKRPVALSSIYYRMEGLPHVPNYGEFGDNEPGSAFVFAPGGIRKVNNVALVIAIGEYRELDDMPNAVSDATALADELEQGFGFKTERLINPTKEAVLSKFRDLHGYLDGESQVFVLVRGRGVYDNMLAEGFFALSDSKKDDRTYISYLSLADLRSRSNALPMKHVFVFLDGDFGDTFGGELAVR